MPARGRSGPLSPQTGLRRSSSNGTYLALGAILLLAAGLRLYDPGLSEFKYDEARVFAQAKAVSLAEPFPLTTDPVSIGIPNAPLTIWLFALPARLSPGDPSGVIVLLALLGTAAVGLTYLLGARFFSAQVGLVAALLFATSPWAIHFGRKIWHQNFPILTALLLIFLYLAVVQRREWAWLAFFAVLALQLQAHITGVLYLMPTALTVLLVRPPIRPLLGGIGVFGLISLPYVLALAGHPFDLAGEVVKHAGLEPWLFDLEAIRLAIWMSSGANLEAILGSQIPRFEPFADLLGLMTFVAAGLLAAGLVFAFRAISRGERQARSHLLLVVWSLGVLLPLVFHPFPLFMHYFYRLLPLPFLLMGVSVMPLTQSPSRWRWMGLALAGSIAAVQVLSVVQFQRVVDGERSPEPFGVPMKDTVALTQAVRAEAALKGIQQVAVLTDGSDPRYDDWPSRFSALLEPALDLRFLGRGGTRALLLSEKQDLVYLLTRDDSLLLETLENWGQMQESTLLSDGTQARVFSVSRVTGEALWEELGVEEVRAPFDNGAELVGYRALTQVVPGAPWRALVLWRFGPIQELERERDNQVFNHFVDADDRLWAQADGFGLASADWRAGDWLLQWVELTLPSDLLRGEYFLSTGHYSLIDGTRASVTDESGQEVSSRVLLGPFPAE